jgi:hypothetical protein
MIEAKGHYENVRQDDFISARIDQQWVRQGTRQVDASGGREIEWYFHEQAAADAAQDLFRQVPDLRRIKIYYLPDPAGIPNPNARIK